MPGTTCFLESSLLPLYWNPSWRLYRGNCEDCAYSCGYSVPLLPHNSVSSDRDSLVRSLTSWLRVWCYSWQSFDVWSVQGFVAIFRSHWLVCFDCCSLWTPPFRHMIDSSVVACQAKHPCWHLTAPQSMCTWCWRCFGISWDQPRLTTCWNQVFRSLTPILIFLCSQSHYPLFSPRLFWSSLSQYPSWIAPAERLKSLE